MSIKDLAEKFERLKNRARRYSSLQITDNCEIVAEGCLKIINCDENVVTLTLLRNTLTVAGKGLKMKSWGGDGVIIRGEVVSLEFGSNNG